MGRRVRARAFFKSRRNSKRSNGIEPFGGLLKSTLDDFLRVDRDYLQLSRLLSKFKSIDHEKNISSCIARVAALRGTFENRPVGGGKLDPRSVILIWDTGASYGLTPFRSDFIDYVECDIPVRDVTKVNKVIGIGTTLHKFTDTDGKPVFIPCVSYHLPQTDVRLFSPQTYHQMHGGYSEVYAESIQMKLRTSTISITIEQGLTNLPVVHDSFVSEKAKRGLGPLMRSGLCRTRISVLDCFGGVDTVVSSVITQSEQTFFPCFPCVGDSSNENLTSPQRELLLWHWKLGINMYRVQELMRERTFEEPLGKRTVLPPIIKPKFPSARNCVIPVCQSCLLARARKRSPNAKRSSVIPESEGALSRDRYEVGDFVSTDQFICKTPGRLPEGFGRESNDRRFQGGTIYNDAASGLIWVENQVSLGANETVMGKARFEQWLWDMAYAEVKHYHGDNGIFSAEEYRQECMDKGQSQSFSGVGAQHQNARAERAIQTIMYMARSFMVHSSLHWTDRGSDDISLWPFAVKHAVWLYNRVPNRLSGLTPLELLTKSKADHRDLLRTHVWGCPAIVLDPKLQNDHKLPKWNRRARVGQFLGYSDEHSSLVANVRHLSTGHVSPQFHVVFDDLFETVIRNGDNDAVVNSICDGLFNRNRELYVEDEFDADDMLIYKPPPLHEVWLDETGRRQGKEDLLRQRRRNEDLMRAQRRETRERIGPTPVSPSPVEDSVPNSATISDDDSLVSSVCSQHSEPEGEFRDDYDDGIVHIPRPPPAPNIRNEGAGPNIIPEGDPPVHAPEGAAIPPAPNISTRTRGRARQYSPAKWMRGADGKLERVNLSELKQQKAMGKLNRAIFALTFGTRQIPPYAQTMSKKKKRLKYKQYVRSLQSSGDRTLQLMSIEDSLPSISDLINSPLSKYITLAANDCGYDGTAEELIVSYVHPLFLKAHSAASKLDNPGWREATRGKYADDYWKAMELEIFTLESIGAWQVVDREDDMNIISSTWAFKCKRYPDGLIKKFKARFCARGDQQLEGIDFFETYAPVVQWTTIRLMFILEILLGLKSMQGDVTCAFLHADLEENETVYVDMPMGFAQYGKNGKKQCLKLKKTLYGLRQSPRAFWKYITVKLEQCGLEQSKFDPCLFIGPEVICVVYVDDLIFWSKDVPLINGVAMQLRELGVDLEQEDDAAGFLGVTLDRDGPSGLLEMKQTGLIKRVIEALGLDDGYAKGKHTPAESKPLVKDADGEGAHGGFSYSSVVGMLLYLSGHTRPDIAYAVNCCARYMFCPKHSHELALKRIGRYLKQTSERGMIMNPSTDICKIDAYPDADFAGMYGHEKPVDPSCVKSRTGFVITFADVPILWKSQLQTETALSTMEAEIIALSACCRDLFPIIDMVESVTRQVNLPIGETTMKLSVHEDNSGALVLAKTLPPQFTPRSKYYAIKTIWFREEIHKRCVQLLKIDTVEQLGDIFTKGLVQVTFEYLRKKIIGW